MVRIELDFFWCYQNETLATITQPPAPGHYGNRAGWAPSSSSLSASHLY